MKKILLEVDGLEVSVDGKKILRGISFNINRGEVVALKGVNGSGKSTLAHVLAGHPRYEVTKGRVSFSGESLLKLSPEERAQRGIFLSFQHPVTLPGVPLGKFLFTAYKAVNKGDNIRDFVKKLEEKCRLLGIDKSFIERAVNEGFSGGEKKRAEILQMAVLEPKLAILDETDSGLDNEASELVASGIRKIMEVNEEMSILMISHYEKFTQLLHPNRHLQLKEGVIRQ